jgi:hypothetical protein
VQASIAFALPGGDNSHSTEALFPCRESPEERHAVEHISTKTLSRGTSVKEGRLVNIKIHTVALGLGSWKLARLPSELRSRNHFFIYGPRMALRLGGGSKTDQNLMATWFIVMKGESAHAGTI